MGIMKSHCKNGHPRTPENLFKNNSCKLCSVGHTKRWRDANPEKVAEYERRHKQWKKENPEHVRGYWLMKHYGVSFEQYQNMLESQEGKCAICQRVMESPKLDHDHDTERVRDLLCNNCNAGLGFFQDDMLVLGRALEYLRRHKNAIPQ